MVGFWTNHLRSLASVRCDDKNGRVSGFPEYVRDLVPLPIIPPNDPNLTAGRRFCLHLECTIPSPLQPQDTVECGFDLSCRETVRVDLLEIPVDPLELPHSRQPLA